MGEFVCNLCPRKCNVDRNKYKGYCKAGSGIRVAKAYLHMWEEPCISGDKGSGTIFFSNCNLCCVFCQNFDISHNGFGKEITAQRLAEIMLELQQDGAHNINLVTPTPYVMQIIDAIRLAKKNGLCIPVIYNSSGYESIEALRRLEGLIDIYLPDLKYYDNKYSVKYSNTFEYFKFASAAVLEMFRQVGEPHFDENGIMTRGLMIRHMMLPGLLFDTKKIIDWVIGHLPDGVYLNIMCQYTPMGNAQSYPEINKKVSKRHYEAVIDYALENGIKNGFFQDFDSATVEYTPKFDLKGV